MPRVLMQVIRFCINSDDKQLKKLCMLYWEVVPKYQELTREELLAGTPVQRKMLPEMLLVINALMLDLEHPNEYVRGSMLRFLSKVKEEQILGPLITNIKANLRHRHPYVRKNAALAIFHAHKLHGETLIPDGPEIIAEFLQQETDSAARRNAFLMLLNENEDLAFEFLANNMDDVGKYGDGFALLVLELTRRVCRRDPSQKSRFVRVLIQMLSSNSAAVSYEASWTLISLSSAPTAVRAAAMTYINLLNGQTDNNVKLIVLERLESLKVNHPKILQELLMDILRALASPSPDICKKVLDVSLDVVTARSVQEVVNVLKREVQKTMSDDSANEDKGPEYRNMLIKTIHGIAVRFPQVAESVVHTLMEFLGTDSGLQVVIFVRAIMEQYPQLRAPLLSKLMTSMSDVTSNQVLCVSLWILGEYSESADTIEQAFDAIKEDAGEGPYLIKTKEKDEKPAESSAPKVVTKNVVLADGTYATQTIYSEAKQVVGDSTPALRRMLLGGDVFLGEVMAATLTKLCLRAGEIPEMDASKLKSMVADSVLMMCGVVKMAEVSVSAQRSSLADCQERITLNCRALIDPKVSEMLKPTILGDGKKRFGEFLKIVKDRELKESKKASGKNEIITQADDLIHFRQLKSIAVQGGDMDLDDGADLARATGYSNAGSLLSNELSHVYQLSGFADPVYAEALVTVHDYDIVLEILVLNRTSSSLANLNVELSTMGDMKIVERPQSQNIGPNDQVTVRASIKVSSTETGHIFGTIVYDDAATSEKQYINLNDIHMDIMDYIRPASCTDEVFRSMWAEFEWENKVAISTSISSLTDFLNHIVSSTNMKCLTPQYQTEKSSFLAANLYARR